MRDLLARHLADAERDAAAWANDPHACCLARLRRRDAAWLRRILTGLDQRAAA